MSDVVATPAPAATPADLAGTLADVALLAGMPGDDLRDFATAFSLLDLGAGDVLWHQATPVDGLHILLTGEVRVTRRLPGEREIEVARLGPGAVMGEIPLLGGGTHSATVRGASPCTLAFLGRDDFHARIQLGRPGALLLKRRIVGIACARIREDHAAIAAGLTAGGGWTARRPGAQVASGALRPAPPPPAGYVSKLPFLRRMGAHLAEALLRTGRTVHAPPRAVLVEEGETPTVCHLTLHGAVEDVLHRDGRSTRVRFAGPGRASGYLGLLDGGPASATSVTRDRAVLLRIDADELRARLEGADELSRGVTAAVEHDLMDVLRSTAAPKAHLAQAAAA